MGDLKGPDHRWGGSSPRSCLQVTVGSGLPTARQRRFTLPPSFTATGEEMFTIRAGTGDRSESQGEGIFPATQTEAAQFQTQDPHLRPSITDPGSPPLGPGVQAQTLLRPHGCRLHSTALHPQTLFLETESLTELEVTTRVTGQCTPGILLTASPVLRLQTCAIKAGILHGCWRHK